MDAPPRRRPAIGVRPEVAIAVVYVAGLFMEILDTTIVNTALPKIAGDFHVGTTSVEWVAIGYLLSLAVCIPASGWIGDRFGNARTLLSAITLFTAASLLCALAGNLGQLVACRVLQGAAGGLMTPVGTAMLFRAFPPERRAKASQVLTIPTVIAPISGPIVGGFIVDHFSWPWIFAVNLPIGIAAVVFGLLALPSDERHPAGRFDVPGFVLSGVGLALGLYALSSGPRSGWGSPAVVITGLGGMVALVAWVVVERHVDEPLLDLGLYRDRLFRACNISIAFTFAAFISVLFAVPLYLQQARGFSPWQSGITSFPEALGVLTSSQLLSGRFYGRIGPRRLVLAGLCTITGITTLLAATLDAHTGLWTVRACVYVVGLGFGLTIVPQQAATFASVAPGAMGRATALYSTVRQAASALGVAIFATVLASAGSHAALPAASDFRPALASSAILAALGAVSALAIRDADAAATMIRPGPSSRDADAAATMIRPGPSSDAAGAGAVAH